MILTVLKCMVPQCISYIGSKKMTTQSKYGYIHSEYQHSCSNNTIVDIRLRSRAATWRIWPNIKKNIVWHTLMHSTSGCLCSIMWKHGVIHRTQSTKHDALLKEKDPVMATGNICKNWNLDMLFSKHLSGQTERQTYGHADCNTSPTY